MNIAAKIKNKKFIKSQNMLSSLKTDTKAAESFLNTAEVESHWDYDQSETNNFTLNRKSVLIKKNNKVVDYLKNSASIDYTTNLRDKNKTHSEILSEFKSTENAYQNREYIDYKDGNGIDI